MTDFNHDELHALCRDGDEASFQRLRERCGSSIDVNAVDRDGHTPAMIALLHHEDPMVCWEWLDEDDGLDWSIARPDGQRLVHLTWSPHKARRTRCAT